MPLNPILAVKIFYMRGINFMGPIPYSFSQKFMLVVVDYISKLVEVISCKTNYYKVVIGFFKSNIVLRFRFCRVINNDGATYFYNKYSRFFWQSTLSHIRWLPQTILKSVAKLRSLIEE